MVAEWNIRQEDAEATRLQRQRTPNRPGHRQPAPTPAPRKGRPQSPANALSLLSKSGGPVNIAPTAGAFWFGKGLVSVS